MSFFLLEDDLDFVKLSPLLQQKLHFSVIAVLMVSKTLLEILKFEALRVDTHNDQNYRRIAVSHI